MTIEERKNRILDKIAEMQAEGQDMRTIAAAIGKLPHGQLKKVLTDDIIAILAKYGVEIAG